MILSLILLFGTVLQVNTILDNVFCKLPSSDGLIIENIPTTFELNVPYTIILSSNDTFLLSHVTLDIEYIDTISNITNDSFCLPTNESSSSYISKTKYILKFEKNSTKTKCIQLKLRSYIYSMEIKIAYLCTNNSADKIFDNDDKYDIQSYMRTINTTEIALLDNFNWLIFGPHVQEIWHTHEGMRLSRECDAAEDGRAAIFNNPRGKRILISRPIDVSNISLLYMRLGSGTCPPPAPTDPPFQLLITTDCLNYSNWLLAYSQQISPGIEHVTVPLSLVNLTNSSTVCLKIQQKGEKFAGSGSWFIDDLLIIRSRQLAEYFFETFQTMRSTNWYRLVGGQLKTCDGRISMVFEPHADIRTEIGATTIDFSLSGIIDYNRDVVFHLSKNISIDWTKWNATGFMDLNKTCTDDDTITFNEENYRQLCSPIIELSRIDSVRFTLSTEPCTKRNKYISTPSAVIFLSAIYNGSTVAYSRTIRRISLREISQSYKTFHIRFDELRHSTTSFGRICLSQYHQSAGKNVDVWSVRDFTALPLLQSNITHYIQLGLNTRCNSQEKAANAPTGAISSQTINVEYSFDFGKTWHLLMNPCFRDTGCSHDVRHVYSSSITLPLSGWHRITLPLPIATLQQEYIRFRVNSGAYTMSAYSTNNVWAIDKVFIGKCPRACSGHGWCQYGSCRCDIGFLGEFCEISNGTLFNRVSFLMDNHDNQTDLMTSQGGRFNYKCDVISRGKALVFSKTGFRFLRISQINGSSPKLVEFTLRLGNANPQCFGTSKNDLDRDLKSILLLSSCSNGVHWTIVDIFRASDIVVRDFRTMSRILFDEKVESENCLIEWRQMIHSGENQDVWAIDDITIRDVISKTLIEKSVPVKTFQLKLTYIRPGYVLNFRLEFVNRKESSKLLFDLNDIQLQINSSEIDLSKHMEIFSYHSENSTFTLIVPIPQLFWYKNVIVNLTMIATKKFTFNLIHLGVQCENNCWLNGICLEGMCLSEQQKLFSQIMHLSFNECDLMKNKINVVNDELLLPFIDSTDLSAVHFQTMTSTAIKNNLLLECSPNGGVKWFEIRIWTREKDNSLKDHYVPLPSFCQEKLALFRWKNSSIQILNIAFVKSQTQPYFMDEFKKMDSSKWLYPIYSINSSGLYTNKIRNISKNKIMYQVISTAITLKQDNYVIMLDTNSNMNHTRLHIDYSLDNVTWRELIDTNNFERPMNRFGRQIPTEILRRSILIRIQSDSSFNLNHIYLGPSCPANCYGYGKCVWKSEQAICQCDNNKTSNANCLRNDLLLPSLYETFENKINYSIWSMPSHVQLTHRCYNRLSKTTPYLCFLPNNYTQQNYAIIGPFKTLKYVIFKFGLQYISLTNCSNQILFQYSYDNGIQWHTKKILDETNNIYERFDDLLINMNIYLRWIEENEFSCLMWNLRSISIRTKNDGNLWFENNQDVKEINGSNYELQTWEFPLTQSSSIIQFDLQMFPLKNLNDTNWSLLLEISSNAMYGWSNWISLIPSCNQKILYCEDKIALTGSAFLAQLYQQQRNVTIPIPDNYVNQEVRFRWTTSQENARFMINKVYVGADCPWFCSGHGLCRSNGCQCNRGYILPYCSPDPSMVLQGEILPIQLNANLSSWSDVWGHEKCSSNDERYVFSKTGTRGLISSELSLVGIKYIRIEFDTCFNRTQIFDDPIHVQISTNNGILWNNLITISCRRESPQRPWLIEIPTDEAMRLYLVRIRLFQRVTTKWISNWILNKFEMIPEKLPRQLIGDGTLSTNICNYKNYTFPREMYSTIDIELNETLFLTFQLDSSPCMTDSPVTSNRSQFHLEFSIDYGQTWSSIDRPSTIASRTNEIIINQPLPAIKNIFFLPLHAYRPLSKFIRIRWLAANSTIATRWQITNVTTRSECKVLCELDFCNGQCRCSGQNNCSSSLRKTTFFERFNNTSPLLSDLLVLPLLNLASTRFIEFYIQMDCQPNVQFISLEYSRNMGLSWQLLKYVILNTNQSNIVHEDLLDEMRFDYVLIRFVFLSNNSSCLKLEQIIVTGSITLEEVIYGKFDQLQNFNPNLFVSFGDGIFNETYLIFPRTNKSNAPANEIITDDINIFENIFYIQLAIAPLLFNRCINVKFSFSSDYGYTWQLIDLNNILLFGESHSERLKIFTWKSTSTMIGSNQVRFRIGFDDEQMPFDEEQFIIGISELYMGSNCINACNGHGMCLGNGRCRCETGWTNSDCGLSLIRFPNEINILDHVYYTSYGAAYNTKCGTIFNNTCKREVQTNYIDINHEHTYVHIELHDQCMSKTNIRKNGDGWIRLQYREINSHEWITLYIFKDHQLNIIKLLPVYILQLRLVQDAPSGGRPPWSIEKFHIFHIHSQLQWFALEDKNATQWNSTFLTKTNSTDQIIYEIKDVYFNLDYILQIEFNCINFTKNILEYSINLGLTWLEIPNEDELQIVPIKSNYENNTIYRLTIPFSLFSIQNNFIRFRLKFSSNCTGDHLKYIHIGNKCSMNCFGNTRCFNSECQTTPVNIPLVDFRETFDKDFNAANWLQLEPYQHSTNKILWTTTNRQAITRPIDLRSMRAIKWAYYFENLSKTCHTSIYLLMSTDGTLTWSILHQFDLPIKNQIAWSKTVELFVELEKITAKHNMGQFRWFQPLSSTCQNVTWGLSRIISVKSINSYFLTDYFYTLASSRSNWESIDGALLAQPDQCNNNIPAFIFHDDSFSVTTIPILIQEFYVLVFQFNAKCDRSGNTKPLQCRNLTSIIEYRTDLSSKWIKLVDMADLACRTSLINGGYFNLHTIKLSSETYSR
ncbi:unnamed protein product [Rotaria magnacalcarata]|uniref:Reelin n=20 Tax=Rotaria magnacalcarata TaxID=392030 RepID=A0A815YSW8_9BILA|nr:unnamed protein product [Rotaria magnacalcarata]